MKKLICILLTLVFIVSILVSCSSKDAQTVGEEKTNDVKNSSDTDENGGENAVIEDELVNNTYKTGYPIVKDKITLNAVVSTGSHVGQFQDMLYWEELEKLTNIHIEFEHYTQSGSEKINLMFASRDFPDIIFSGANDKQVMDAAAAGDIIPLNDLLKEYGPNWSKVLEDMPYARKVITMPDGNIYTLPHIIDGDVQKGFRDQWLINIKWIDELGLSIPTTTEEYRQVLKVFKENAGKGSIPENVMPWYFRHNQYVGGQFDIFGSFGILVPDSTYLIVDNGKVQFQAINPDIKEPIKYLHELYVEGLIPPEAFTDDWDAYINKTRSEAPICGVMHSFHNPDLTETIYKAIAPIKAPGVDMPLYRQQTSRVNKNKFAIFANNKYPEASMRLADTLAEVDWSIEGHFGIFGMHVEKISDEKIRLLPEDKLEELYNYVPGNSVCLAVTKEISDRIEYDGALKIRQKAFEMYKPYIAPLENFYPPVVFTDEQIDRKSVFSTDILGYVDEKIAHWIVDGGIDDEWDDYVVKIEEMGLNQLIEVYQEALDVFNSN